MTVDKDLTLERKIRWRIVERKRRRREEKKKRRKRGGIK